MTEPSVLFWDLGGVVLSNGWDRQARRRAVERFELDEADFRDRHELVVKDFETGRLSLGGYLGCTVFHRQRDFTPDDFKEYMFGQSEAQPETLAVAQELAAGGRYRMATLNNESRELNQYRIERFGLQRIFELFFCSCILGVAKPEAAIYRIALQVVQKPPSACVLIDDRALNVERAAAVGIRTIHYRDPRQLREELGSLGVRLEEGG